MSKVSAALSPSHFRPIAAEWLNTVQYTSSLVLDSNIRYSVFWMLCVRVRSVKRSLAQFKFVFSSGGNPNFANGLWGSVCCSDWNLGLGHLRRNPRTFRALNQMFTHINYLRHEESIKVCCRLVHIDCLYCLCLILIHPTSSCILLTWSKVPAAKPVREGAVWKDLHYTRRWHHLSVTRACFALND